jgi:phosphoglycolate phosphatase-like HAD superfamily hydrolase
VQRTRLTQRSSRSGSHPLGDVEALRRSFALPLHDWFKGLGVAADQLREAVDRWNREMTSRRRQCAWGAPELLAELRRREVTTAVITAASRAVVAPEAERLGISPLLEHIDGDVTVKRDAIVARTLASGRAARPISENRVRPHGSHSRGATPIGVRGGYRPQACLVAVGAAHVIDDLRELLPHL